MYVAGTQVIVVGISIIFPDAYITLNCIQFITVAHRHASDGRNISCLYINKTKENEGMSENEWIKTL